MSKKNTLWIVGCAHSRNDVNWKDPDADYLGVNNLFLSEPDRPWSVWFEIHDIKKQGSQFYRRDEPEFRNQPMNDYIKALNKLDIPVYTAKKWKEIKKSVKYPLDKVVKEFGTYLTNSISFQIAWAILEGYKTINIYGVDMAVASKLTLSNEYSWQRPSCEYFIGLARGMGITVNIPDTSDLLKARFMYAFDEPKESAFDKKINEQIIHIDKQVGKAIATKEENRAGMFRAEGAKWCWETIQKIFKEAPPAEHKAVMQKLYSDMEKERLEKFHVSRDSERKENQGKGAIVAMQEVHRTWSGGDSNYLHGIISAAAVEVPEVDIDLKGGCACSK